MPSFIEFETWGPEFVRDLRIARFNHPPPEKVIVFSDYSAGAQGGQYDAYSYGFVTSDSVVEWTSQGSLWRQTMLSEGRLIEWKKLSDAIRWKALPSFLNVAAILDGWCITILVDRKIDERKSAWLASGSYRGHSGKQMLVASLFRADPNLTTCASARTSQKTQSGNPVLWTRFS